MIHKLTTLVALTGLALLVSAGPATAVPTATTSMEITNDAPGACSGGYAMHRVSANITITNGSSADVDTVQDVTYSAKYSQPGASGQITTNDVTVVNDGGLVPGVTLQPGESRTFAVVVDVRLPCDATAASLRIDYNLVNGHKTFFASGQFVSGGTPVPIVMMGSVTLAAVLGVVLIVASRRRRPVPALIRAGR